MVVFGLVFMLVPFGLFFFCDGVIERKRKRSKGSIIKIAVGSVLLLPAAVFIVHLVVASVLLALGLELF